MNIPSVGVFEIRSGIAAVNFQRDLVENIKGVIRLPLTLRQ